MNPFALLKRAANLPGPTLVGGLAVRNYHYLYVSTTTQSIHLPTVLDGFSATEPGYLIVKNTGPGVIHWTFSNENDVELASDDGGPGAPGWPLFYGETEHCQCEGNTKIYLMSPTEAGFWVRVGS